MLATEHAVTLLVPTGSGSVPLPPVAPSVRVETYRRSTVDRGLGLLAAILAGRPWQSGLYRSRHLAQRLRELAPRHDLAIVTLARLADHLADLGRMPWVVDAIDSLSFNLERRARLDHRILAPLLAAEAARLARVEQLLVATSRAVVVVAERDRRALLAHGARSPAPGLAEGVRGPWQADRVRVIPLAFSAPPADDGGRARLEPLAGEAGAPPQVILTGNLGYFVNADAARWFCREVVPPLRRARPEVGVLLAGDRPPGSVRRAATAAGVGLLAAPPDLPAVLAAATVAVAPLRAGSGQPIKVMEAWAAGVPVVASSWAAAGTTGVAGEDLLVADTPDEWVRAILRLLDTPQLRRQLAAAGRRRLASDYAPERVGTAWRELVLWAAAHPGNQETPTSTAWCPG